MQKIDVAGLKINNFSKPELLKELEKNIRNKQKTWVTTLYSEFLYAALRDKQILEMLNKADIALADGIGILWAKTYLEIPPTPPPYSPPPSDSGRGEKNKFKGKLENVNHWKIIFKAYFQALAVLIKFAFPFFSPSPATGGGGQGRGLGTQIERIPGRELVSDIAELAEKNNWSIYLLGGFGETPKLAAEQLISRSADQKIRVQYSNKNPEDVSIIDDINIANPDILFVAFGPIRQEKWILENLPKLSSINLVMGVGGTFDYLAGIYPKPPKILAQMGLEWLWRLLTQPKRYKRIFHATWGLVSELIKYKIKSSQV